MSEKRAEKPFPCEGRAFLHAVWHFTYKGFFAQQVENKVNKSVGV